MFLSICIFFFSFLNNAGCSLHYSSYCIAWWNRRTGKDASDRLDDATCHACSLASLYSIDTNANIRDSRAANKTRRCCPRKLGYAHFLCCVLSVQSSRRWLQCSVLRTRHCIGPRTARSLFTPFFGRTQTMAHSLLIYLQSIFQTACACSSLGVREHRHLADTVQTVHATCSYQLVRCQRTCFAVYSERCNCI